MLHHFMSIILTFYSATYNLTGYILAGMVLFDSSDAFDKITNLLHYSKLSAKYPYFYMVIEFINPILWFFTRIFICSYCFLNRQYEKTLDASIDWAYCYWPFTLVMIFLSNVILLNIHWAVQKSKKAIGKIKRNFEISSKWKKGQLTEADLKND